MYPRQPFPAPEHPEQILDYLHYCIALVGDGDKNGTPELAVALETAWDLIDGAIERPPREVPRYTPEQLSKLFKGREAPSFGACPFCLREGHCLNVNRDHWFMCPEDRVRWYVGSNLFSGWKHETPVNWARNTLLLDSYAIGRASDRGSADDSGHCRSLF